jgi:ribosome-binding factor A
MKRTDDLVRRIISEALLTKVQDPRIGMVTVTDVEVSSEFDTARVFVSVLGDEDVRRESMTGLRSAAPFLPSQLAVLRMRRIPRLKFIYDESVARGFRINEALRGLGPDGEGDEPVS